MRWSLGLWLLGLGACYEVPGTDALQVIAIDPAKKSLPADGFSTVDLEVTLDAAAAFSQAITVTVSDGTVNFAATGPDARTVTLKLPRGAGDGSNPTKMASVPYRVGRTPGVVELTAAVSDITARSTLMLTPEQPTHMFSEASVSSLTANGTTKADVNVHLLQVPPVQVSLSTQVASRVCCLDASGALMTCVAPPPLRATGVVVLTAGDTVTVAATTEPYTGPALQVAVVSSVVADPMATPACAADGMTSSSVTLTLHP